jgi:hypothetical protein
MRLSTFLSVVFLCLSAVIATAAQPSIPARAGDKKTKDFFQALEEAKIKAQEAFSSHQIGQPTLEQAVVLPSEPEDPEQKLQLESFKVVLFGAKDIQEGCDLPCDKPADAALYESKIMVLAQQLGATEAGFGAMRKNYILNSIPRKKRGQGGASSGGTPEQQVEKNALGKPKYTDANGGDVIIAAGIKRRLSAEEMKQLNAAQSAQARYLRTLATRPPPSPELTPVEKQRKAVQEARKAAEVPREYTGKILQDIGNVGGAYKYWDDVAKDEKNHWWITRMYAKANKGLITVSGLKDVEQSAGRLGYVWDNQDVGGWQKFKMGANLAGNSALAAMNFLPVASIAKGGKAAYTVGKGGTAIKGMAAAGDDAARAMKATTQTLQQTIKTAIPQGQKATVQEMRTLIDETNKVLKGHGVAIKEGGVVGESVAKNGVVKVSLKAGAPHEVAHAMQSAQTQALMLEQQAAKLGKPVGMLSEVERAAAFSKAELFEAGAYAQHEMQAFRATGFMGKGNPNYANMLLKDSDELYQALKTGTVIQGQFSAGQKVYGALTMLGRSQFQIAANLSPIVSQTLLTQKAAWGGILDGWRPDLFSDSAKPPEPAKK